MKGTARGFLLAGLRRLPGIEAMKLRRPDNDYNDYTQSVGRPAQARPVSAK